MECASSTVDITRQAREADEQRAKIRKRNLQVLVQRYLMDQGYTASAAAFDEETHQTLREFEVCDNVDLEMVLMEYESYQYVKFQRYPRIVKKNSNAGSGDFKPPKTHLTKKLPQTSPGRLPQIVPPSNNRAGSSDKGLASSIQVKSIHELQNGLGRHPGVSSAPAEETSQVNKDRMADRRKDEHISDHTERLLKPLGGFKTASEEMKQLAQVMSQDIYLDSPNVKWEDIIGLEDAKTLVKEAIIYPLKYPEFFKGIVSPWKSVLLYGPPGTGKTLIAKAVATECRTTFFNISASSIGSKFRGESEKLVRILFELARYHAPSTIFLDELDSIMSHRGGDADGNSDANCRVKTELLIQMDGLAKSDKLVFILAASNLPWRLDKAMLRRLEKRVLVRLPCPIARQFMISRWLPPVSYIGDLKLEAVLDLERLVEEMKEYSGSDIKLVCREAAMKPLRSIFEMLESHKDGRSRLARTKLSPINTEVFLDVLRRNRPAAQGLTERYEAWEKQFKAV